MDTRLRVGCYQRILGHKYVGINLAQNLATKFHDELMWVGGKEGSALVRHDKLYVAGKPIRTIHGRATDETRDEKILAIAKLFHALYQTTRFDLPDTPLYWRWVHGKERIVLPLPRMRKWSLSTRPMDVIRLMRHAMVTYYILADESSEVLTSSYDRKNSRVENELTIQWVKAVRDHFLDDDGKAKNELKPFEQQRLLALTWLQKKGFSGKTKLGFEKFSDLELTFKGKHKKKVIKERYGRGEATFKWVKGKKYDDLEDIVNDIDDIPDLDLDQEQSNREKQLERYEEGKSEESLEDGVIAKKLEELNLVKIDGESEEETIERIEKEERKSQLKGILQRLELPEEENETTENMWERINEKVKSLRKSMNGKFVMSRLDIFEPVGLLSAVCKTGGVTAMDGLVDAFVRYLSHGRDLRATGAAQTHYGETAWTEFFPNVEAALSGKPAPGEAAGRARSRAVGDTGGTGGGGGGGGGTGGGGGGRGEEKCPDEVNRIADTVDAIAEALQGMKGLGRAESKKQGKKGEKNKKTANTKTIPISVQKIRIVKLSDLNQAEKLSSFVPPKGEALIDDNTKNKYNIWAVENKRAQNNKIIPIGTFLFAIVESYCRNFKPMVRKCLEVREQLYSDWKKEHPDELDGAWTEENRENAIAFLEKDTWLRNYTIRLYTAARNNKTGRTITQKDVLVGKKGVIPVLWELKTPAFSALEQIIKKETDTQVKGRVDEDSNEVREVDENVNSNVDWNELDEQSRQDEQQRDRYQQRDREQQEKEEEEQRKNDREYFVQNIQQWCKGDELFEKITTWRALQNRVSNIPHYDDEYKRAWNIFQWFIQKKNETRIRAANVNLEELVLSDDIRYLKKQLKEDIEAYVRQKNLDASNSNSSTSDADSDSGSDSSSSDSDTDSDSDSDSDNGDSSSSDGGVNELFKSGNDGPVGTDAFEASSDSSDSDGEETDKNPTPEATVTPTPTPSPEETVKPSPSPLTVSPQEAEKQKIEAKKQAEAAKKAKIKAEKQIQNEISAIAAERTDDTTLPYINSQTNRYKQLIIGDPNVAEKKKRKLRDFYTTIRANTTGEKLDEINDKIKNLNNKWTLLQNLGSESGSESESESESGVGSEINVARVVEKTAKRPEKYKNAAKTIFPSLDGYDVNYSTTSPLKLWKMFQRVNLLKADKLNKFKGQIIGPFTFIDEFANEIDKDAKYVIEGETGGFPQKTIIDGVRRILDMRQKADELDTTPEDQGLEEGKWYCVVSKDRKETTIGGKTKPDQLLCVVLVNKETNSFEDYAIFKMEDLFFDDSRIYSRGLKGRIWILENKKELQDTAFLKNLPSFKEDVTKRTKQIKIQILKAAKKKEEKKKKGEESSSEEEEEEEKGEEDMIAQFENSLSDKMAYDNEVKEKLQKYIQEVFLPKYLSQDVFPQKCRRRNVH